MLSRSAYFEPTESWLESAITASATALGAMSDPTGIQDVQVAFDAEDVPAVRAFWAAALGFEPIRDSHLRSPDRIGPTLFVNEGVGSGRPGGPRGPRP